MINKLILNMLFTIISGVHTTHPSNTSKLQVIYDHDNDDLVPKAHSLVKFYPRADNLTQPLHVMLVTNITSVLFFNKTKSF